jgi:ABC-type Fe3+-siderophore transport system permease subunit
MINIIKQRSVLYPCLLILLLTDIVLGGFLQYTQHIDLLTHTSSSFADIVVWHTVLPRIVMALLVGGTLGVATILLQQISNNVLASDSTLAVNGGAHLSLLVITIFSPPLLGMLNGALWAMIGALLTLGIVLVLSVRQHIMTLRMMLVGMILDLFFSAIATVLMLYYPEESKSVLQWGAGSLIQDSWHDVLQLAIVNLIAIGALYFLIRPLQIMELDDAQARSLGVSVTLVRCSVLVLVSFLVAVVVSLVGMIGFIGLAAAIIVRKCRFSSLLERIVTTYLLSGLLLLLTDIVLQLVQRSTTIYLPVGVATAFLGAPLLLYILFRSYEQNLAYQDSSAVFGPSRAQPTSWILINLVLLFVFLLIANLLVKQTMTGYVLINIHDELVLSAMPRLLTALSGGVILAVGGMILQRISNNPLASPEILGVNAGAAIFILGALLLTSIPLQFLWLVGITGAFATLAFILAINYRNQLQPDKVLISGIAVTALMGALIRLFMTNGDPRAQFLLAWLSGSTYYSSWMGSIGGLVIALFAVVFALVMRRVLALFAFTPPIAQSLGLNVFRSRIVLLCIGALLSGVFTLLLGPLSFIGLLAPHLARVLGCTTVKRQLTGAALIGANLMLCADWLAKNLLFPYEIPTSLIATTVGACCFLLCVRKT